MKIRHSIMHLNPITPNILKMVKHTLNAFPFEEGYFFDLSYFEFWYLSTTYVTKYVRTLLKVKNFKNTGYYWNVI